MTHAQEIITIAICAAGTMATRFLPFFVFRENRPVPDFVRYLGQALPSAIFAMLVVYCLRNVDFTSGARGLPELLSIAATALLHITIRRMTVSILGGTTCYALLSRFLF